MFSYAKLGEYTIFKFNEFIIYSRIGDYRYLLGLTFLKGELI